MRFAIHLLVCGLFGVAVVNVAVAQDIPTPKIALVDVQLLMRDAKASQSIRDQIERQREKFQSEIEGREEELRKLDQQLAQQRAVLSSEAFAERQKEFQSKVAETQRHVQNRKRQLDQAFAQAMNRVEEAVAAAAKEVAARKGVNIVLTRNMVIYANSAMDITQEVLADVDRRLPSIEVSFPN